ncbi:MAG: hypothetical protein E7055_01990 [Lentisphaerae bacterium]|nr:hypothetical protein [Lentisphaerota bacterium]
MRLFFISITIVCFSAMSGQLEEKCVVNGIKISTLRYSSIIPYSKELFGINHHFPSPVKKLQNIVNKTDDGSFIVFSNTEIIFIANKKNGVFNGKLSIYPDGIFSVHATIKNGILNGKCNMTFQPFKYAHGSKLSSSVNYDFRKIPVPHEQWICNGKQDFILNTEGYFMDGKKFNGSFLQIEPYMDLRIVTIQNYCNFILISKSNPVVYKIVPWINTF